MPPATPPVIEAPAVASPPPLPSTDAAPGLLRRALWFPIKFVLGMMFCQALLGSLLVVGWASRLAQRAALKRWWLCAARGHAGTFREFLDGDPATRAHRHWPNWFLRQNFAETRRGIGSLVASLGDNFWRGLQVAFNTCVLVLPAAALWWFAWYDGWNNSFNKGYEQFAVGPALGVAGTALFIAAMFYVPLAQARQSVTGDWRSFYDWRLVWTLARLRWLSCVVLAGLYSALSVPVSALRIAPAVLMNVNPAIANFTDAQAVQFLNRYHCFAALVVLPVFVLLRGLAARIYAGGIVEAVQSGRISADVLAANERTALARLNLLRLRPPPLRNSFVKFLAWSTTRAGRAAGTVLIALLWFTFVAQLYVAEFFNYHTVMAWVNQPLVQLPWFHYVPVRLKNPTGEFLLAVLVILVALVVRSLARRRRS